MNYMNAHTVTSLWQGLRDNSPVNNLNYVPLPY
jgi:hypothetical protein